MCKNNNVFFYISESIFKLVFKSTGYFVVGINVWPFVIIYGVKLI